MLLVNIRVLCSLVQIYFYTKQTQERHKDRKACYKRLVHCMWISISHMYYVYINEELTGKNSEFGADACIYSTWEVFTTGILVPRTAYYIIESSFTIFD